MAAGKAPGTVEQRVLLARRIMRDLPDWRTASCEQLESWLARHDWAPDSRRSARTGVRMFYSWAARTGRVASDPSIDLPTVRIPEAQPRPCPETLLARVLADVSGRDRMAILLAAKMGLRRGEIARARVEHIGDGWLHVKGKGGRRRSIPLHADVLELLPESGPLVPNQVDGRPLAAEHVGRILSRALGPGWTGHTLRHRFSGVTHEHLNGDIRTVQQLLGHSNLNTTQRYVPPRWDKLADAVRAA
jgi:integrase